MIPKIHDKLWEDGYMQGFDEGMTCGFWTGVGVVFFVFIVVSLIVHWH